MINFNAAFWPEWDSYSLWRWLMMALGVVAISYGLLNKTMRFRDGSRIKQGWPSLFARAWFVLIGIGCIIFACSDVK